MKSPSGSMLGPRNGQAVAEIIPKRQTVLAQRLDYRDEGVEAAESFVAARAAADLALRDADADVAF